MGNNKRSIPEIRDRLREIADEAGIEELQDLADQLYRKSPVKRAPNRSAHLTPELAEEIRNFVAENPTLHQRDVAQEFDVNPGRVSEALNHQA